jgi:phosphoadenosine phosphosulfate reductase
MQFHLSLNRKLSQMPAERILQWAGETFGEQLAVSSSFQTQSLPLLHLVTRTLPDVPVLFLDTGFHFPETLAFRDRLVADWRLNLVVLRAERPASGVEGVPHDNPDVCCQIHKVEPMRRAMQAYRGWISGIRRDQSEIRAAAQVLESTAPERFRIHPMLNWQQSDIDAYVARHGLPQHPLTERG